jgi:hypothetical protein
VVLFSVFQLLQAFLFCLKFTYQQSSIEYILMIGVIGGLVSAFEAVVRLLLGTPQFFLGECLMLALFFAPNFSLLPLLELKYLRVL